MKSIIQLFLFIVVCTHSSCTYSQSEKFIFDFKVRQPSVYTENPPLLILMHGLGSNEDDLYGLSQHLASQFLIVSLRAPISMDAKSFAWYELDISKPVWKMNSQQQEHNKKKIIQFITQLQSRYRFDKSKVFLGGFSQGAIMSYSVAIERPDLIKGIVAFSGKILDVDIARLNKVKPLSKLNVLIFHGSSDKIIPSSFGVNASVLMKQTGAKVEYLEKYYSHTIHPSSIPKLNQWLNLLSKQ